MATYAEQIASFTAERAVKADKQKSIMDAAAEKGETLDAEQQEEFDTLSDEIDAIDKHLDRLTRVEKSAGKGAAPVNGQSSEDASASRGGERIQVKAQPKLAPGIALARLVKCVGMGNGIMGEAANIARKRYGDQSDAFGVLKSLAERGEKISVESVEKASVVAGSTTSGSWTEDLVSTEGAAIADFVEYLRPQTIVGRFGQGGIPALRSVPFRVPLVTQTAKGAGYWVGEGKPKPLTSWDYSRTTLTPLKVANIAVLTEELIRDNSANADTLVRDELVAALKERIDLDFIDPTKTASAGISPASITNGSAHGAASGTGDADDVRADIRSLLGEYIAANNPPTSAVLIMQSATALALSLMTNALGQREFNDVSMSGGNLLGIPVITSEYVTAGVVIIVNATDIYFADEGGFSVDLSREASLQMLDNPTNDTVTPTATSLVSMFQTNSVAFRAERALNWAKRRNTAVAYLTGVAWGGAVNDLS